MRFGRRSGLPNAAAAPYNHRRLKPPPVPSQSSVADRLARAAARRASVHSGDTDCYRLVDGSADGFPGLVIDVFAGRWLLQTRDQDLPAWAAELTEPKSVYWKRLDQTNKEPPKHITGAAIAEPFLTTENGVKYVIDFAAGYSQGIFLDQRDNRRQIRGLSRAKDVLNLFAYTCAFSVCAGAGGGTSVSVDLSRPSLEWGKRNFDANGLNPAEHEFIAGEAADWLKRFGKKGRKFDVVIIDPPTFSRDKKGKVFRVERDFGKLSGAAMSLLRGRGTLLCTTNQRSLSRGAFAKLILDEAADASAWKLTHAPMPPDFTGEPYLKTCWVTRR
jgi:23S rRNA (cytosine1962-C5)-methyltransferase